MIRELVRGGHLDEAFDFAAQNDDPEVVTTIRALQGRASTTEALDAIRSQPSRGFYRDPTLLYWIGATDELFEELNKQITERNLYPPLLTGFSALSSDPRWAPMLRRMGLEP